MKNLRKFEAYRMMYFNVHLKKDVNKMDKAIDKFDRLNEELQRQDLFSFEKIPLKKTGDFEPLRKELNCVILDLEGENPVKMVGMLIRDKVYSYWLKENNISRFYLSILRLIKMMHKEGILFFGFTYWDYDRLMEMREKMRKTFPNESYDFTYLDDLKYFNLQEREMQSITETLYSLDLKIPKDPLFRTGRQANDLFEDGFIKIVQQHNISCLKSESLLFSHLFLKKHLIK
jgi:hypothetical protein